MARPVVLVVDDEPVNLDLVEGFLGDVQCKVVTARDGEQALEVLAQRNVDLVLLDGVMPKLDGFEVCRRIKADSRTRLLPVVFLSGLTDVADRVRALEVGADDFIAKPVDQLELVARVRSLLRLKSLYDRLEDSGQVIAALARAVEAKDAHTEAHTERVARAAVALARAANVAPQALEDIYLGGLIHDIGKIGIPDALLGKPGPLSESELVLMRSHVSLGAAIVRPLRSSAALVPIVLYHHERWDGKGYPDRLAGEAIPMPARIVAVCDAYDAMVSERPYRPALTPERAEAIMRRGAGVQWDPRLVTLFFDCGVRRAAIVA